MHDNDTYPTGEKIKQARKEIELTQVQMAQHLGVTRQTYRYLEDGQVDPRFLMIQKISAVTKKPLSYFYESQQIDELEREKLINSSRNQGIVFACRKLAELYDRADLAQSLIETIGITVDCGRPKDAEKLKELFCQQHTKKQQ